MHGFRYEVGNGPNLGVRLNLSARILNLSARILYLSVRILILSARFLFLVQFECTIFESDSVCTVFEFEYGF